MSQRLGASVAIVAMTVLAGSTVCPAQEAIEAKVAGMIDQIDDGRLERTVKDLVGFGTRHVLSRIDSETEGTGAARSYLQREYEALIPLSGGRLSVERMEFELETAQRSVPAGTVLVNIVATLRGTTDPDRVYVVAGHYDSRNDRGGDGKGVAPGANDDGSGTAGALEACRVMCGTEFGATIVFAAFDGEEQGLLGAGECARRLVAAGARVDGMITADMIGNTLGMDGIRRADYLRCFSYARTGNDSSGRSLARAASFAARRHVDDLAIKLVFRGDRYGRGGDHRPFFNQGFPAVRFTEPREDYSRQHQGIGERDGKPYGDIPAYVDFDYAARSTAVVVATLAELASAPPPPSVSRVSGARDRYDTIVSFRLPEGVADYEFVWRDTTAPDWQAVVSRKAANVRSGRRGLAATLEGVCVDDVVVGVRSVGADGSRSRVATPPEPDRFNMRGDRGR